MEHASAKTVSLALQKVRDGPMRALVQSMIGSYVPPMMITVADIPGVAQYQRLQYVRASLHVGQLKLFLSEVQFLTDYARPVTQTYVVYAGSAPGHSRFMLATMFPAIKFVLIDPQEHNIMGSAQSDILYFRTSARTEFARTPINLATTNAIVERPKGTQMRENEMLSADDIARVILREKGYTFYIIEDLFTNDLARAFRALSAAGNIVYFISDIRTNTNSRGGDEEDEHPSDLDIIANNMWQHMWVHLLQPAACMLKFRTPFMNPRDIEIVRTRARDSMYSATIAEYDKMFKRDTLAEYSAHRYMFIDNNVLNLQAFPGQSSTEVRLIATQAKYSQMREYSTTQHENALFYYNQMREYCFIPANRAHFSAVPGLDGCVDCRLTLAILARYSEKYGAHSDPYVGAISLLQRVLHLMHRTIKSQFHGQLFAPIPNINQVLSLIIARASASAAINAH